MSHTTPQVSYPRIYLTKRAVEMALTNGYVQLYQPAYDRLLSFVGPGPVQIDINVNTLKIISKLFHPKRKSATKLGRSVRNEFDFLLLLPKIFENPRTHTGLGKHLAWTLGEKEQFSYNISHM